VQRVAVVQSTLSLVLGTVFEIGGSNGITSDWAKSKMAPVAIVQTSNVHIFTLSHGKIDEKIVCEEYTLRWYS